MKKKKKGVLGLLLSFIAVFGCFSGTLAQAQEGKFVAVEIQGVKLWLGGGDIDLKGNRGSKQLVFKLINKLDAEHGFAIDAMKLKQVVKAGEEMTVTVPIADVDPSVSVVRYYCHLHPGHIGGTMVLVK